MQVLAIHILVNHLNINHITQWLKEKVQKYKQPSTKHTYKTKDWVIQTPLKSGVNLGAPEG